MGPDKPLPLPESFADRSTEEYVDSLLEFATSSRVLQNLCGGIHILDFFTSTPDLYSSVLPENWREWFNRRSMMDVLDVLMRKDLPLVSSCEQNGFQDTVSKDEDALPETLVRYIRDVRSHLLNREPLALEPSSLQSRRQNALAHEVTVGMKAKKIEEVTHFASYVDQLTQDLVAFENIDITHLIDFGSGQNYLGRALASKPYNKHVVALESKPHNITGAKKYDEIAKIRDKPINMINKKQFRAEQDGLLHKSNTLVPKESDIIPSITLTTSSVQPGMPREPALFKTEPATLQYSGSFEGRGSVQYLEYFIRDGNLAPVVEKVLGHSQRQTPSHNGATDHSPSLKQEDESQATKSVTPRLLVTSLHSCGNLVHHGIRSLILNPSVSAVALIGCCYNLVTERLGPPTNKLPTLRTRNPRLESTSASFDPHGFPMSDHLCQYEHKHGKGIRLNITARMMAVQAPQNWGPEDSEGFFTRHFYRALLQRIFLDYGVVKEPEVCNNLAATDRCEASPGATNSIIIGSLRKSCYTSFVAYVRGALKKLLNDSEFGLLIQEKLGAISDETIKQYERNFHHRKHDISVMWSLMAFSAGVVEAIMVVDRWLFLKEQECVKKCWVEPVFDYGQSPRNLVVVGIKK